MSGPGNVLTIDDIRDGLRKFARALQASPSTTTQKNAAKRLDGIHEALIDIVVRELHAASCLSRAGRALDAKDNKTATRALRAALRDLDGLR